MIMDNCKYCTANCALRGTDNESRCKEFVGGMTKADRIRAMSDEELACWLGKYFDCYVCPIGLACLQDEGCKGALIDWLKQPAGER